VGGLAVVDRQLGDREAGEVEVEPGEVLGGADGEDRPAVQVFGARVVSERQIVVGDVVAAVPGQREVGVADARLPDGPGRGGARGDEDGGEGEGDREGGTSGGQGRSLVWEVRNALHIR